MTSFLLLIVPIIGLIWWLHRSERRRHLDNADRNAPLPAVDPSAVVLEQRWTRTPADTLSASSPTTSSPTTSPPEMPLTALVPEATESTTNSEDASLSFSPTTPTLGPEHWQEQLKTLRDADALDAALTLARAHFPRLHALQQAAVILRQQLRQGIERKQNVDCLLGELYDTALVASLPRKTTRTLSSLGATSALRYKTIGFEHLKLLTKNDVRHLRQLWGEPERHQSVDASLPHF